MMLYLWSGCRGHLKSINFRSERVTPFTPKGDQCQISPAASTGILHHTVWRTWLFIAYEVDKWLYYQFSLHHSYVSLLKGWENVLLELGSERVKVGALLPELNRFRRYPQMSLTAFLELIAGCGEPSRLCPQEEYWRRTESAFALHTKLRVGPFMNWSGPNILIRDCWSVVTCWPGKLHHFSSSVFGLEPIVAIV